MSKLMTLYNNTKKLVYDSIFEVLSAPKNLDKLADLQRNRLWDTGTYFTGEIIRTFSARFGQVYANKTIGEKMRVGLPYDRVTLYQTGNFLDSIVSKTKGKKIISAAKFKKKDGNIGDNVFADKVLGWSDADMDTIIEELYPQFIAKIKDKLWK